MASQVHNGISRRRAIKWAGASGLGLTAAALIGCTSSNSTTPAGGASKSAATAVVGNATGAQAVSGGTLKYTVPADVETLDRYKGSAPTGWSLPTYFVGSRLLRFDNGKGQPATGKIIPDLAKSFEQVDPTTLLFHLDPAAKFDGRAPTNGRVVNAEDIVQSWKRYAGEAAERTTMANSANKDASITEVVAVDDKTVRIKLAFADALVISQLAGVGGLWIQPTEGIAGKFDQTREMRGSGPWMLEEYRRSVGYTFKRNPAWHHGGAAKQPYLDAVNVSIIPERAQTEAQFRAKNVYANAVAQQNIPQFAKELKGTRVVTATPTQNGPLWGFSWADSQPWKDVRIRRALAMTVDRDTLANVIFDPKRFEPIGLKLDVFWNSPLGAGWGDYWMNPKGKDAGPAGEWLKHNVAESKKLMTAAGYSGGKTLDFDIVYPGVYYGLDWPTRAETVSSMVADAGFKVRQTSIDYTQFIAGYWRGGAKFEGKNQKNAMQFPPGGSAGSTALEWCISYFTAKGVSTAVADAFPDLEALVKKQRNVADFESQKQGLFEIQRYVLDNMIVMPVGPSTQAVDLTWDFLHGPGEIQGWPGGFPVQTEFHEYWMEKGSPS